VSVACGDATDSSGVYRVLAEGLPVVDGSPTPRRFVEVVEVRAGRFAFQSSAGAVR